MNSWIWTRTFEFQLVLLSFQLVTRNSQLVTCDSQLVTRALLYRILATMWKFWYICTLMQFSALNNEAILTYSPLNNTLFTFCKRDSTIFKLLFGSNIFSELWETFDNKFLKMNSKHWNRAFFYFPRKSRCNCRDTDVFTNIVKLLLLLYYTFRLVYNKFLKVFVDDFFKFWNKHLPLLSTPNWIIGPIYSFKSK